MKRFLSGLPLFLSVSTLLAQSPTPEDAVTTTTTTATPPSAAAIAALTGCGLLPCVAGFLFWIIVAIWVMRDAKRRNSQNATLVTVLAWIPATTVIGLIVHLVTRPKTNGTMPPTTPPTNL